MKALKVIGGILILIVAVFAVLAFVAPTNIHVERSATIDAPKDFVLSHVDNFAMINAWSPWTKRDPDMTTSMEGEDGTVGCKYSWSSDVENVGVGEQTIESIEDGEIVTHLHFIKPWESEATSITTVEEVEEGKSKVTWAFESESPRPMNIMNLFMDMDEMLGPDFQEGMDNLTVLVDKNKADRSEFDGIMIEKTEMSPRTYVGVRDTIAMSEIKDFFTNNFGKVYGAAGKAGAEISGMPSGIFFSWDEASGQTELMAAVPVNGDKKVGKYEQFAVSGPALMVKKYGPYEETGQAHMAIEKYMNWHGIEPAGPAIEEYANDPETVSDPSEILTIVYYPIAG